MQVRIRSSTDGVAVFLAAWSYSHVQCNNTVPADENVTRLHSLAVQSCELSPWPGQDLFSYANAAALLRQLTFESSFAHAVLSCSLDSFWSKVRALNRPGRQ